MNKESSVESNNPVRSTGRFLAYLPEANLYRSCMNGIDAYVEMHQDKKFIECYGITFTKAQILERLASDIAHWEKYSFGPWLWYDKEILAFVGRAGLKTVNVEGEEAIELAYAINPSYWGQGVAVELGWAALEFAVELNLKQLVCFTMTTNTQSLRVMEKLGFCYDRDFIRADLPHKLYRLELRNNVSNSLTIERISCIFNTNNNGVPK